MLSISKSLPIKDESIITTFNVSGQDANSKNTKTKQHVFSTAFFTYRTSEEGTAIAFVHLSIRFFPLYL